MKRVFCLFITVSLLIPTGLMAIPAQGQRMMISGPSPYAVEVGKDIARKGGNVVDVAVGVGLTLAVTSPYYAGLGGGGFALIRLKKEVEVLDFRETAPSATSPEFYLNKAPNASRDGGSAVGIPGFPAGLWAMHQKYGKLHWSRLFEIPLKLATRGFEVSGEWSTNTRRAKDRFNEGGRKHFLKKGGKPYLPGDTLKQKALAKVLKRMRVRGPIPFYQGPIARDIVDSVRATGGVMTLDDLKNYKIRWLKPLTVDFRGHKIHFMPPPSSGGVVLISALKLIEKVELEKHQAFSINELHLLAEIMKRAFRGRALLGDPDFHQNPVSYLTSDKYLFELAESINMKKVAKLEPIKGPFKESTETTHYSVMDGKGNAVSLTVTLNGNYGSAVVSNKYGIALNNEMDDFTTRPGEPNMFGLIQGQGNVVEPGKRPLSSMSPTLVEKNSNIVMALGAPGGPRIINGVLQVLYRTLVTGLDMDQAIQAPRVHHQFLPNTLFVDQKRFAPETLQGLRQKGHEIRQSWIAKVYGIRVNSDGLLEAAFDSRGEGAAGGF